MYIVKERRRLCRSWGARLFSEVTTQRVPEVNATISARTFFSSQFVRVIFLLL